MIFMKKSAKNILLSFLAISSLMSCQSANNTLDIVTNFDRPCHLHSPLVYHLQ